MVNKAKLKTINALKNARENILEEQDRYRKIIENLREVGARDYIDNLPTIGWGGMAEIMQEEHYPPDHEQRKEILGQNLDSIPNKVALDKISEFDIKIETYFLNETLDQCHRIKSTAKFLESLNASPEDKYAVMLFGYWCRNAIYTQFAMEYAAAGNHKKEQSMKQLAELWAETFDMFAKGPDLPERLEQTLWKSI